MTLRYLLPFLLSTLIIGCVQKNKPNSLVDELDCQYDYNNQGLKHGKYSCNYPNGNLYIEGVIHKDSVKVFEETIYFKSGKIKSYKFYNPKGSLVYEREYGANGIIINEGGQFFSHFMISKPTFTVFDSSIFRVFVASPQGVKYNVFGIDSDGDYEMNLKNKDEKYIKEKVLKVSKAGNYTLPIKIIVFDSTNNQSVTYKDNLDFKVLDEN